MTTSITDEAYQPLMIKLGKEGPILEEKTFNIEPGFSVRDENGVETVYTYWDVIYRADKTYWSPLGTADRLTLYNITNYYVLSKSTHEWLSIAEWFALERM